MTIDDVVMAYGEASIYALKRIAEANGDDTEIERLSSIDPYTAGACIVGIMCHNFETCGDTAGFGTPI